MESKRLPQFLCLGAQKAGTTTLHHMLAAHPQVFLPPGKEVHFFSLHYQLGPAWYAAHFEQALPEQHLGEITPYYLFHPLAPARIAALLPEVRCIALLRDPVERCLSHYFHARRLGFEDLTLPEALAAESSRLEGALLRLSVGDGRDLAHQELSYLSRSRYDEQLVRYDHLRQQGRLLILRSEDLFAKTSQCWQQIQHFLRLDPQPLRSSLNPANAGQGEADRVDSALRWQVRQALMGTYAVLDERYGLHWPELVP